MDMCRRLPRMPPPAQRLRRRVPRIMTHDGLIGFERTIRCDALHRNRAARVMTDQQRSPIRRQTQMARIQTARRNNLPQAIMAFVVLPQNSHLPARRLTDLTHRIDKWQHRMLDQVGGVPQPNRCLRQNLKSVILAIVNNIDAG